MKHNLIAFALVAFLLAVGRRHGCAQGTFVNLDFEHPIPPLVFGQRVPITNALPGWTGYIGGIQQDQVFYDAQSTGAAEIALMDSASDYQPFQGSYFVLFGPDFNGGHLAAIAQLGTVPSTAESVRFYAYGSLAVTFAGQQIPLYALGGTSAYTIYGGNISSFKGQTGWLQFQGNAFLDNIQFSNLPIPEPGVFGLSALGALLVGWRVLWRRR
jgi:hypothetical protein